MVPGTFVFKHIEVIGNADKTVTSLPLSTWSICAEKWSHFNCAWKVIENKYPMGLPFRRACYFQSHSHPCSEIPRVESLKWNLIQGINPCFPHHDPPTDLCQQACQLWVNRLSCFDHNLCFCWIDSSPGVWPVSHWRGLVAQDQTQLFGVVFYFLRIWFALWPRTTYSFIPQTLMSTLCHSWGLHMTSAT